MIDGTNRHSGLERDNTSRTRSRLTKKKPDVSHACPRRSGQEPATETTKKRPARHKDTMVLLLAFQSVAKDLIKLGRFSRTFAEKRCKEL